MEHGVPLVPAGGRREATIAFTGPVFFGSSSSSSSSSSKNKPPCRMLRKPSSSVPSVHIFIIDPDSPLSITSAVTQPTLCCPRRQTHLSFCRFNFSRSLLRCRLLVWYLR
ncbi:hypothetical protein JMJ77_0000925, partial [Colletotrichum scovillei]